MDLRATVTYNIVYQSVFLLQEFITKLSGACQNDFVAQLLTGKELSSYMESCVKLCLLMRATDPPIVIECPAWKECRDYPFNSAGPTHTSSQMEVGLQNVDTHIHNADKGLSSPLVFNRDKFKDYTRRGKYIEYVVWPLMLLHDNGPVLNKGVAQGTDEHSIQQTDKTFLWLGPLN